MTDNHEELIGKLAELETKVDEYTTDQGRLLEEAVAKAKAAWDAEDDAEHAAAIAAIEEIGAKLVTFSPSGN